MDLPMRTEPPPSYAIAVELIDDDGQRRVAPSPQSDAALTASIRRRGVLQAVGVRPVGDRFQIVFGRRRLRCARLAELTQIPALVRSWTDDEVAAVKAAENMQRQALHPIDAWQAVCELLDRGASIAEAAEELGLDEAQTRRMERLGRLHPDMLALIELEMPRDRELRLVANAPLSTQQKAMKGVRAKPGQFNWDAIAARCKVERIARELAIFDADLYPELWDEDLFAQPDDSDRFTTADVERFLTLQKEALVARVGKERGEKRRVLLSEFDATKHEVKLPKGFRLISTIPGTKPKRTECAFTAVSPDGRVREVVATDVAAQRAAERRREQRQAERAQPATPSNASADLSSGPVEGRQRSDAPAEAAPDSAKTPFTKAGLALIAVAKTKALRETLHTGIADLPLEKLPALLLLALAADNIELRIGDAEDAPDLEDWQQRHAWKQLKDVVAALLLPGGGLIELSTADIRMHVGRALARLLAATGPDTNRWANPGSGDAAEWIGAAINAAAALPRFDTAEFLATVNGETLRALANQAAIKPTGAVAALREKLVGALPDWRPEAAQFGAPAPQLSQNAEP